MSKSDFFRICNNAKVYYNDGTTVVLELPQGIHGVITVNGDVVVPFGLFDWISRFDNGLARVKLGKRTNGIKDSGNKWGIINTKGQLVLPVIYDNLWNFIGKGWKYVICEKDGIAYKIDLEELRKQ